MKRLRLKPDADEHFSVLTNTAIPSPTKCFGCGTDGLDGANHAPACTGWVEQGDDYLVVWQVPKKIRQSIHCSECALEFPGSIVEEKPDATRS